MLRLGRVAFLNTDPLFARLGTPPGVTVVDGVPTDLNRWLLEGSIDLGCASSIEFARYPDRYAILPDLSISSRAAVGSVILASRTPVHPGPMGPPLVVFPTPASATSVTLLRVLASPGLRVLPPIELVSDREDAQAELMIGDAALAERLSPTFPHQVDLGQLWSSATGKPMVWALFLVRRDVMRGAQAAALWSLQGTLARAARRPAIVAAARAHAQTHGQSEKALVDYLAGLDWTLSPAHIEGLRRFYVLARDAGVIRQAPEPEVAFASVAVAL